MTKPTYDELAEIVTGLHQCGLVIESSVRYSEGEETENYKSIRRLERKARTAVAALKATAAEKPDEAATSAEQPTMRRFWFLISDDDYRPMAWPPSGPFWNSGFVGDKFVVVAYAPDLETLTNKDHWPDAEEIDDLGEKQITFTDRFPEPEWWRKLREENV